jgi:eukaryotic-like serine/threonine-protein kinase
MPRSDSTTEVARKRGTPATDTARVGTVIGGRYRLEALIGRGGMGVVYRAAHTGLRKQVAIKVLHPSLASSPEVRSRFEREALAIGKIDHPNCVGVFDVGTMDDGALYLVMELLEGKSLGDLLDEQGQLPPTRALHILKHILNGLSHIHHAELVHRDIKPENVYLVVHGDDRDFAKILDFGIAKPMKASDLDDGVKLTQAGVAFGTPIYMSPEQAIGNPIDGRADLYSAAALGFEMLTGQPPFYSDDKLEVMSMHTTRPTPPMSSRLMKGGAPVSEAIERVIAKGLAKRPSERYQSADEFISALNELMEVGGATEVEIRPMRRITGSQPLAVSHTGTVTIDAVARPLASRPVALPGVAPLPGDQVPSASTTGVLVRAPSRVVSLPAPKLEEAPSLGRPWWVYVAAAVLAAAVGVGVATVTIPREKKLVIEGPVAAAARFNQIGLPDKALALLEKDKEKIADDPLGQLELGHARAVRSEYLQALDAYERALVLEPELQSGPAIRSALREMSRLAVANDRDAEVVGRAFALLMKFFDLPDTEQLLIATAQDADANAKRRKAALTVIEHLHLEDKLDRYTLYSIDLRQGEDCEARKQSIVNLRSLGDPRAIELLKSIVDKYEEPAPAVRRKGKGRSKQAAAKARIQRKKRDEYGCLVEDAKAAVAYLSDLAAQKKVIESLTPPPQPPAGDATPLPGPSATTPAPTEPSTDPLHPSAPQAAAHP